MVATPKNTQPSASQSQADDRVAVLLTGYGEVEDYDNFASYNRQALDLLTTKFAPIPKAVTPVISWYLANADREEWEQQHDGFVSPHNAIFEQQRQGIEQVLQNRWGERVQVFKAFNFCEPYLPEQVLANIKSQGFDKILIFPLLVVDSIFTSGIALEQVNNGIAQLSSEHDIWVKGIRYIPSFFDQPDYTHLLAQMVEEQAESLLSAHSPSQVGIVLMNHGCPEEAGGYETGEYESQALYGRVRQQLVHQYPLISIGWLNHDTPLVEWTQPDADQAAENLIALGAEAIIFAPIGFATDNHETILDVEHIIEELQGQYPHKTFLRMDCVNDHPEFMHMAAAWTEPLIEQLLSASALPGNSAPAAATAPRSRD